MRFVLKPGHSCLLSAIQKKTKRWIVYIYEREVKSKQPVCQGVHRRWQMRSIHQINLQSQPDDSMARIP